VRKQSPEGRVASAKKAPARARAAAPVDEGEIIGGSDNIFADLGFENPDDELLKADLAGAIAGLIRQAGLTQAGAADRMGTTQPKVSLLLRGRTEGFSVEKLFEFLNQLGQDVVVEVRPARREATRGQTGVVERIKQVGARVQEKLGEYLELPPNRHFAVADAPSGVYRAAKTYRKKSSAVQGKAASPRKANKLTSGRPAGTKSGSKPAARGSTRSAPSARTR